MELVNRIMPELWCAQPPEGWTEEDYYNHLSAIERIVGPSGALEVAEKQAVISNREKAQAAFYLKLARQVFEAYGRLFPSYAYIEDNAVKVIVREFESCRADLAAAEQQRDEARRERDAARAEAAALREEVARLRAVVEGLLADPFGCPFCDSGKLRNPNKPHLDDCPYLVARAALEGGKA